MSRIDTLPPLREVIESKGLRAKKSLGQNFLLDLNLTSRIARAAGDLDGVEVLEIGPGPGGLTRALLACGARRVVAIERDERCVAALQEIADHYPGRLEVIEGDALTVNWQDAIGQPCKIVANLPYNIATVLLTQWLETREWPPYFTSLTLMFQKEVAERICATAGDNAYGRLSVLCNWRTTTRKLFDVGPEAFTPPPKVTSSVVQLLPRDTFPECSLDALLEVTKAAFGQRRKMLRSSLKRLGGAELVERAGLEGQQRAEEVDVEGFVKLANALDFKP